MDILYECSSYEDLWLILKCKKECDLMWVWITLLMKLKICYLVHQSDVSSLSFVTHKNSYWWCKYQIWNQTNTITISYEIFKFKS